MFEKIGITKILLASELVAIPRYRYTTRPHLLLYKISGQTSFAFYGSGNDANNIVSRLSFEGQDFLYIPSGCCYDVTIEKGPSRYMAIAFFTNESFHAHVQTFKLDNPAEVYQIIKRLIVLSPIRDESNSLQCKAYLYEILAKLTKSQETLHVSSVTAHKLSAADEYLNDHLYSSDLTVQMLSEKASMSITYYRQLFKQSHGVTPMTYITNCRIKQARTIIENTPNMPIHLVAELVGYPDPLYFSKVFKKVTSHSPMEYQKICRLFDDLTKESE